VANLSITFFATPSSTSSSSKSLEATFCRGDISELKSVRLEQGSIMLELMQCVQIIFDKGTDEKSIKKTLADVNFLRDLKDAEPKNIEKSTINKLKAKKNQCPN
jgi:hypothetical protein